MRDGPQSYLRMKRPFLDSLLALIVLAVPWFAVRMGAQSAANLQEVGVLL